MLIAFSLCFYVLMHCQINVFENPWKSVLKILAMLIGELDYEGNFMADSVEQAPNIIMIQIISACFLFFGSIVIMNLLVGLAASEIDKIKSEALLMSMKGKVSMMVLLQKNLGKETVNQRREKAQAPTIVFLMHLECSMFLQV